MSLHRLSFAARHWQAVVLPERYIVPICYSVWFRRGITDEEAKAARLEYSLTLALTPTSSKYSSIPTSAFPRPRSRQLTTGRYARVPKKHLDEVLGYSSQ